MSKPIIDRLIAGWVGTVFLAALLIAIFGMIFTQLTAKGGPDYCALANMRSCQVEQRGEWVLVTGPDGSQHMIYMQNGKVLQVN